MTYKKIESIWERTKKDIDLSKLTDLNREELKKQIKDAFAHPAQQTFSKRQHSGNVSNLATDDFADACLSNSSIRLDIEKEIGKPYRETEFTTKTGKKRTVFRINAGFTIDGKKVGGRLVSKGFLEREGWL